MPRDADGRMATLNLIRVRESFSVFFGECKFRGSEGLAEQRYHFVLSGTTQGPPHETKDLEIAQESLRYS